MKMRPGRSSCGPYISYDLSLVDTLSVLDNDPAAVLVQRFESIIVVKLQIISTDTVIGRPGSPYRLQLRRSELPRGAA